MGRPRNRAMRNTGTGFVVLSHHSLLYICVNHFIVTTIRPRVTRDTTWPIATKYWRIFTFFSVVVGLMSAQLGLIWAGSNLRKGDGLLIHNGPWAVQNLLFLLFSSLMHTGLWLRRISCKYLAKLMLIGDQIGRHCRPNSEPRHLGPLVPVVADLPGRRGH